MIARVASRRAGYGVGPDDVARFADEGCRRAGHRRLRHQRSRSAGAGARARPRRDRHRPPPGAVGRERGVRAHQPAPARRSLPVQGARVVRRGVLPGGRAAHAPGRRRRRASIRATCWIWWRWARSPISCRSSTRTGSWSPPVCGSRRRASVPGCARWRRSRASSPRTPITAEHVSFRLAPRLNAAGPPRRGAAGAGSVAGARRRDRRSAGRRAGRMQPPAPDDPGTGLDRGADRVRAARDRRRAGGRRRGLAPGRGRHRRRQAGREVRAARRSWSASRRGRGGARRAPCRGSISTTRSRRAPRTCRATAATPPPRA